MEMNANQHNENLPPFVSVVLISYRLAVCRGLEHWRSIYSSTHSFCASLIRNCWDYVYGMWQCNAWLFERKKTFVKKIIEKKNLGCDIWTYITTRKMSDYSSPLHRTNGYAALTELTEQPSFRPVNKAVHHHTGDTASQWHRRLGCIFNRFYYPPQQRKTETLLHWPRERGNHRWLVDSPHTGPAMRKISMPWPHHDQRADKDFFS